MRATGTGYLEQKAQIRALPAMQSAFHSYQAQNLHEELYLYLFKTTVYYYKELRERFIHGNPTFWIKIQNR